LSARKERRTILSGQEIIDKANQQVSDELMETLIEYSQSRTSPFSQQ